MAARKRCKSDGCETDVESAGLEASGYCFTCAEEIACLLAGEGLSAELVAKVAYGARSWENKGEQR